MNNKGAGYYLEYRKKSGEIQKAQCFHKEQVAAFKKRIFIHLINDDLSPRIGEGGKKECALIDLSQQTRIFGHFD